jgi:tRNA uridine 5-carboxymethylaminomethyl modification enzyme
VDKDRWAKFCKKLEGIDNLKQYLQDTRTKGLSLWEHMRRPDSNVPQTLTENPDIKNMRLDKAVLQAVTIDAKYEGYLAKQQRLVASFRTLENRKLPADLDYRKIVHLRAEAIEKLSAFRPATMGQASRIAGITPADITVIQVYLKKYH